MRCNAPCCHLQTDYRGSVQVGYDGPRRWGMVRLATLMFFRGRHIGAGGVLRTWLPSCLLAAALAVGLSVGLS